MMKRLGALILLPLIFAGTSAMSGQTGLRNTSVPTPSPDLTVHEWGTFTSVAGPDGRAVEWTPFSGPSDLPCFVTILNPTSIKVGPKGYLPTIKATVRMETPVIYFYSDRAQTVNARVRFPHGLITEWYPQAAVPPVPFGQPSGEDDGRDHVERREDLAARPRHFPRGSRTRATTTRLAKRTRRRSRSDRSTRSSCSIAVWRASRCPSPRA